MTDKNMRRTQKAIVSMDDSPANLSNPMWDNLCLEVMTAVKYRNVLSGSTAPVEAYRPDPLLCNGYRVRGIILRCELTHSALTDLREDLQGILRSNRVQEAMPEHKVFTVLVETFGKASDSFIVTRDEDTTWEKFIGAEK